jgi:hypothetical protein
MPALPAETHLQDITHTIQLAVAPVFLLTALGTTLSVLTTRLGRIVDRARRLEDRPAAEGELHEGLDVELRRLAYRARLIQRALTAGTLAMLLVCVLIAVAFVGYLYGADFGAAVAVLFILAMGCFVAALLLFLREVFLALGTLSFRLAGGARAPKPGP